MLEFVPRIDVSAGIDQMMDNFMVTLCHADSQGRLAFIVLTLPVINYKHPLQPEVTLSVMLSCLLKEVIS